MAVTEDDLLHVASLAHLKLSPGEIAGYLADLNRILGYVAQLDNLDTSQVEPTTQVSVAEAPLRGDRVTSSLAPSTVAGEAPQWSEQGFVVPAFIEV